MHLTLFGATGGIGRHLIPQALEAGHTVTAFTRDGNRIEPAPERLEIVEGDVLDPRAVTDAVSGRDAVICALGMPLLNNEGLRARGTANIVRAMETTGTRRLICLSSLGTGESRQILPLHYRWFIVPLFMRRLLADHEAQEALVRASTLDWTIVRPGSFTDREQQSGYRHGFTLADPSLAYKVARRDVADFMLRQLGDDTYLHAAPGLSY